MRTDLDHLPAAKQRELEEVVRILFAEFREATENATGRRKSARILKIILFGSYARGDWVDAPFDANQYKSDMDILVIVNQKEMADVAAYWSAAEQRLIDAYIIEKRINTPVHFIVHSLQQVNQGLAHGRVFFMEIAEQGIALYDGDSRELAKPKPKTPNQALEAAQEYFDEYFPDAMSNFELAKVAVERNFHKQAAFLFHRTTEALYQAILLTLTFYTPYDHNVAFLRLQAEGRNQSLFDVWPRGTRKERAMFQKLKDAYVKARYSKHYRITPEELNWLAERIKILGQMTHEICTAHIANLRRNAAH
ncbi:MULTISPECIES: nucleotidyltransferase and HEPN domain-containing protein [unclassified Sphingobium]|uniref:nucleotidyltransferase and HEPN domain-containing protein n=1 Tax=unclassified Sphingobium TaxID=2611147 RepID=UPI000D16E5DB|nr:MULTISPECIES: nucleotidyltransferase domain-containing protein [unclassified Sphingobium]MBG6119810.1 putative nucleotidyltransferase/HEPN domain-containing protein [Sphingobium sp. JAI105]PSO09515.1 nucleotidyltransferase [Sphingobium sp. AEW4]TWC95165.1 putative nucleotidyltransferase [Sphingobium sp. AEW010]TWD14066.1 putative nucleotidyltransferase [Sphingobium sp. AEW013]TWD18382.1 putative nucleotidyltransferase [Sphingobium sp. AEW001]